MPRLELALLGSFQVCVDGRRRTAFATDKVRGLLAYLAVEADRPHRRQALAALFWPNQSERAALTNLRQTLCRLRRIIHDADPLLITVQDLQFDRVGSSWLDTAELDEVIETCRAHHRGGEVLCPYCCQRLTSAAALYRGEFLAGLCLHECDEFTTWQTARRVHYHQQALKAVGWLGFSHEQCQEFRRASDFAQREIELEPWSEPAHRRRMRLLAKAGHTAAAIHQFAICRELLAGELGLEPSARTLSLYEQIRTGSMEH